MVFRIIVSILVVFVAASSILLHHAMNQWFLVLFGLLFILSTVIQRQTLSHRIVQVVFLGGFHWFSHLNWCDVLYLAILGREVYRARSLAKAVALSMCFELLYTAMRLAYVPYTAYNLLVSVFDLATFLVFGVSVQYLFHYREERALLSKENDRLWTHDPLTGLLNYQEFHQRLDKQLNEKHNLALFLIDCADLKSMNHARGFQNVNQVLKNVADRLQAMIPDATLLARYGGDEFAVTIGWREKNAMLERFSHLFEYELPKVLDIDLTYGYALCPDDGATKDSLISVAEQNLFARKRDLWLKREDQFLRSEKLKVIGELAAGMAHEIRNPLTSVKGFIQLSKERDYNIGPWYECIMEEITRMSELTAEFLQASRHSVPRFEKQSLHECIQRSIQLVQPKATSLGHRINYESHDPSLYSMVDKDRLVQVMLNIIGNSFDAMVAEGTVSLCVTKQGERAIIEVADTGSGIPAVSIAQIFDPFFTTKDNGTGIGLYVCHKIIQDHGGTIDVDSVPGVGTVFRIALPLLPESS